jgi:hypothetical protein
LRVRTTPQKLSSPEDVSSQLIAGIVTERILQRGQTGKFSIGCVVQLYLVVGGVNDADVNETDINILFIFDYYSYLIIIHIRIFKK